MTTILENYLGNSIPKRTLKSNRSEQHIFTSYKTSELRVLTNITEEGFSTNIPVSLPKAIINHVAFESNKVIALTTDNKLTILKFTTFGFCEKIAQNAPVLSSNYASKNEGGRDSAGPGLIEKLDEIAISPNQDMVFVSTIKEIVGQKKYCGSLLVLMVTKEAKMGNQSAYKFDIFKKFSFDFSSNLVTKALFCVTGTWKNGPLLAISEVSDITRIYTNQVSPDTVRKRDVEEQFEKLDVVSISPDIDSTSLFVLSAKGEVYKFEDSNHQ